MVAATTIALDGAFNARAFGAPRPWLVRSSALDALTPSGRAALHDLGVTRVVDLREPGEGGRGAHDVEVVAVPVYGPADGVPVTGRIESIFDRLLDERGTALAEAVRAIADAPGTVAVHCTIGKDRTGLVVALTLLAAGASEDDVTADYVRSGPEVLPHRRDHVEQALSSLTLSDADRADAWRLNLQSPPEVMQHLFRRLAEQGGATEYLRAHGLEPRQRDALRARLWA